MSGKFFRVRFRTSLKTWRKNWGVSEFPTLPQALKLTWSSLDHEPNAVLKRRNARVLQHDETNVLGFQMEESWGKVCR